MSEKRDRGRETRSEFAREQIWKLRWQKPRVRVPGMVLHIYQGIAQCDRRISTPSTTKPVMTWNTTDLRNKAWTLSFIAMVKGENVVRKRKRSKTSGKCKSRYNPHDVRFEKWHKKIVGSCTFSEVRRQYREDTLMCWGQSAVMNNGRPQKKAISHIDTSPRHAR